MLIPLRHENMQGRRWPVITIGIIALNVIAFLGTHWTMDKQGPELGEVKMHLILLAAMHPEAQNLRQSAGIRNLDPDEKPEPLEGSAKSEQGRAGRLGCAKCA